MRAAGRVPLCQLPWLVLTVAGVVAGAAVTCGVAVVGVVVAGTAARVVGDVEDEGATVEGDVAGTVAVVGEAVGVGATAAIGRAAARDLCSEAEAMPTVMPAKDKAPAAPAARRARRAGWRRRAGDVELRMPQACTSHLATGSRTAPHILRKFQLARN